MEKFIEGLNDAPFCELKLKELLPERPAVLLPAVCFVFDSNGVLASKPN